MRRLLVKKGKNLVFKTNWGRGGRVQATGKMKQKMTTIDHGDVVVAEITAPGSNDKPGVYKITKIYEIRKLQRKPAFHGRYR